MRYVLMVCTDESALCALSPEGCCRVASVFSRRPMPPLAGTDAEYRYFNRSLEEIGTVDAS
jgi:hypothetical protein